MLKRVLTIIGICLLIIIVGSYVTYDYWLERQLKYQLSEILSRDPNSPYSYSFDQLDIDLFDGSVDLLGISIEPRERALDSLANSSSQRRSLIQLKMNKVELIGFELRRFFEHNEIEIQSIIFTEPSITYFFNPLKKNREIKNSTPLKNFFDEQFTAAKLGEFRIVDGQLSIDNFINPDPALTIHNFNIVLTNARIDSTSLKNFYPIVYDDINILASDVEMDFSKDFTITSDSLSFDATNKSILIHSFQIKPKYNQENFSKVYDFQKQWVAIVLDTLVLKHIDFEEFFISGLLEVGQIDIIAPNIALYKDKSKPESPYKKKLLPASLLREIPMSLDIKTTNIKNGYLTINEISPLTLEKSFLSFYDLNGQITNFSNVNIDEDSYLNLRASARIYKQAETNLEMNFKLTSPIDNFTASGSMGRVDMKAFNPVLEPMIGIRATDGNIEQLTFKFAAMDTMSTGILDMEYTAAKLEVLKQDSVTDKTRKGLLSLVANTFIKSNNLKSQSNYRQGVIKTSRVLQKDVWPFLWHSIQSGIITTLAPVLNSKEVKEQQKSYRQELKNQRKE